MRAAALLVLALPVLASGGCASSMAQPPLADVTSASPQGGAGAGADADVEGDALSGLPPREQVARLEERLQARQAGLGGDRAPAQAEATQAAPRAAAPAPPGPTWQGGQGGGGRCRDVCRASEDICGYSKRICKLAAQIGDEESHRACQRSETACAEAGQQCRVCR